MVCRINHEQVGVHLIPIRAPVANSISGPVIYTVNLQGLATTSKNRMNIPVPTPAFTPHHRPITRPLPRSARSILFLSFQQR
ncbi:hypothetical protein BY458DRAFT_245903 [Sporodiniella umbellata]|nr:hypothetical protein BY458DRAFT_245903 [Sporodiniella umbellata]